MEGRRIQGVSDKLWEVDKSKIWTLSLILPIPYDADDDNDDDDDDDDFGQKVW